MKAAFLTGIEQVELRDVPEPKLTNPTDVKLRVEAVGVCGSDMHYYRVGRIGDQVVQFPWTVGHECAATVVEVGPNVKTVKPGDRVAIDPLRVCGTCDQCLAGREHTCRHQAFMGCPGQAEGALAEYIIMQGRCCFPVPASMTFTRAAAVEPFTIGLYAQRLGGDAAGKTAVVLGTGPIGLSVLLAMKQAGASKVYASDIRDSRKALAAQMGADWVGNPEKQDIVAEITAAEPLGVDMIFECAGEQDTIDQGVTLLRPGGSLLLVGIPEVDRVSFNISAMRRKELTVQNVRRQNECIPDAVDLVARGKVDIDPMVTHHFTMDQTARAFDLVAHYRDNVIKAIIHVTDNE